MSSEENGEASKEASPVYTVYCHTHLESCRRYIGITKKTMLQRWNQHVYTAKRTTGKGWSHFANAIRTYGQEAFSHEVLQTCDSLEEANKAEEHWVSIYDTTNPLRGFNIARGGNHTPHPVKNPWERPGFREKNLPHILKLNAAQTSAIRSANVKKLWQNPEYRESVISSTLAAVTTPEFRASMSDRVKGMWQEPELRSKFEAATRERAKDPEFRKSQSERWNDPSYREKCSVGTRSANESKRTATHCPKGHLREVDDSTPSGWARECHQCINERRKEARTHCPKGHPYSDDNVIKAAGGKRICKICRDASIGNQPCHKCGGPKNRRSGDRFRCGPCTDSRVAAWKIHRSL